QPQPHGRGGVRDVLVDVGVREPGQRQGPPLHEHLGLGTRTGQRADQVEHLGGEVDFAHPRTPTRTPVNRAGADGWPVWPICPGWPLPQFGVPHVTISPDSMSIPCPLWTAYRRAAGVPSSSYPNEPSAPGIVGSMTMFISSDP